MRFAVIGDIHGNKYALVSVIKHIEQQNVDFIASTGDLVGYLPYPNEVVELIRKNRIVSIQGNHDHHFAFSNTIKEEETRDMTEKERQGNASSVYTNMVLTDESKHYLRQLPKHIRLDMGDLQVMIVHGSPRKNAEYMHQSSDVLGEIVDEGHANVIICGHTHIPYYEQVNGTHIINAGSVGKPKHGKPESTYVIVNIVDNEVSVEIHEVLYDQTQLFQSIEENPFISNQLIDMLTKGY